MTILPQTLVLATRNAGKIRELADGLAAFGHTVLGLEAFPDLPDVEETGLTFEENALLKARAVAMATGHIAVADDSGLEVDALNGAPGVWSARYAQNWESLSGERSPGESHDAKNCRKLLHELHNVPDAQRTARFVCVMAVCTPGGHTLTTRGIWEGRIARSPDGENGFGYDPVFLDPNTKHTAAMLSREEKNARSHRGYALRKLCELWPDFMAKRKYD